jgi:hypothetical protein
VEKPKEDLIFSAIISSLRKFHLPERQSVILANSRIQKAMFSASYPNGPMSINPMI